VQTRPPTTIVDGQFGQDGGFGPFAGVAGARRDAAPNTIAAAARPTTNRRNESFIMDLLGA
jgi:hypothetical protein